MKQEPEYSELISVIYDAALDYTLWEKALGKACDFVGGYSASLLTKDATHRDGELYFGDGRLSPHFKRLYFEKFISLDPLNAGHYFAEIGEPVSTADLMHHAEFRKTRLYREWAEPQDLVDFASTTLDKSATHAVLLGMFRHKRQGLVNHEVKTRLRLLAPHFRRAMLIGKVIDSSVTASRTLAETLDRLRAAVFLINDEGMVVYANASGHDLISAGDVLRIRAGRLSALNERNQHALREALSEAVRGDLAIGSKGIALALTDRGHVDYLAHVMPASSGIRASVLNQGASAAVFIHKVAFESPTVPDVIAKHYRLTPMELRVLLAIVELGSVPQVAEALGVAESTIKTHLHRLFSKTGTVRQTDLVKLLATLANPLSETLERSNKTAFVSSLFENERADHGTP